MMIFYLLRYNNKFDYTQHCCIWYIGFYHWVQLKEKVSQTGWLIFYSYKVCALLHTHPRLSLGQIINIHNKVNHIHHRYFWSGHDELVYDGTCLHNNSLTPFIVDMLLVMFMVHYIIPFGASIHDLFFAHLLNSIIVFLQKIDGLTFRPNFQINQLLLNVEQYLSFRLVYTGHCFCHTTHQSIIVHWIQYINYI